MKKYLLILSVLLQTICFAQPFSFLASSRPAPFPMGTIISHPNFPNLSDFTANNSPTTSVSGNELTISGGTQTFSKSITEITYGTTNLCEWTITAVFRPQNVTSAVDFCGFGVHGDPSSGGQGTIQAGMLSSTNGSLKGQLQIYKNSSAVLTGNKVTYSQNDRIQVVFTRSAQTLSLAISNLTTGTAAVTGSVTLNPTSTSNLIVNSGKFAIFTYNGTAIIESFNVSSAAWMYPQAVFLGDSKVEGFCASTFANAWPQQFYSGSTKKYNLMAKGNSVTQDVINGLHEIIQQKPKYAVLLVGSNDKRFSVSDATFQANCQTIATALRNAGIQLIWCTPMKETTLNQTTVDTYIRTTFSAEPLIDFYTGWNTGTMLNADGIHPNDTGQNYAVTILNAGFTYLK